MPASVKTLALTAMMKLLLEAEYAEKILSQAGWPAPSQC